MKLNTLSFIQKDFLSLKFYFYNDAESLSVEEIKRHLLIKMHHLNNEIADHFYEQEIANKFDYINENGDTPTYKLFEPYINAFNIQIENPDLLKWILRTPLSLKLFCEL